jgi:hypothetical protein
MRSWTTFLGAGVLGVAIAVGCGTGGGVDTSGVGASSSSGGEAGVAPTGATLAGDIPCDVAEIMSRSCTSCHTDPPNGGAKVPLTKRAHFLAPAVTDASKNVGVLSVERMKDTRKPMPPDGVLPASDVAIVEKWVAAGMPDGQCASPPGLGKSPYDTPRDICTSDTFWTRGEAESADMLPGEVCNDCHVKRRHPNISSIGGTVYPTAHEKDKCNGGPSVAGAEVVFTDVDGKELRRTKVRSPSGNFYEKPSVFTLPAAGAKVYVEQAGKKRHMSAVVKDGDCNKCHTMDGSGADASDPNKAPGRIMLP